MERWEYALVSYNNGGVYQNGTFTESREVSSFREAQEMLAEHFQKLGEEGWELISVPDGLTGNYVFKRPKQ